MDLAAYVILTDEMFKNYVNEHYGEPPRPRGIRLMKYEKEGFAGDGKEGSMWDSFCGKDVIYVHTRCGSASWGDDDPEANYMYFGADKWEEANADTFLGSVNDDWDGTYRDHFFKAVPGPDYDELCREYEKMLMGGD